MVPAKIAWATDTGSTRRYVPKMAAANIEAGTGGNTSRMLSMGDWKTFHIKFDIYILSLASPCMRVFRGKPGRQSLIMID